MKYVAPSYEKEIVEIEDIIASNEKYEVENNDDGTGNVIMNAIDIFR